MNEVEACVRSDFERLVRVVAVVTESTPAAQDAVLEAFARAWEREAAGGELGPSTRTGSRCGATTQ